MSEPPFVEETNKEDTTPQKMRLLCVFSSLYYLRYSSTLDDDRYYYALAGSAGGTFSRTGMHQYRLEAPEVEILEFTMAFAPVLMCHQLPSFDETRVAASAHREQFWQTGGAVDLSGSSDPRTPELERRIVLSQYFTAINCAGSMPLQETGLVCNSWHGKFHLEMHWWHAAHFALWGRPQLLERSLPWYQRTLPVAQAISRRQGYRGVRAAAAGTCAGVVLRQPHDGCQSNIRTGLLVLGVGDGAALA